MLTKTKIALATALILGTASAALASNENDERGGFQVQTWQQIEQDRRDIQNQIQRQYPGNASGAFGYVVSPKQTHRAAHVRSNDR
jgi:CHASE3 domain sensor protein